jgi:predicted aminopeptidase
MKPMLLKNAPRLPALTRAAVLACALFSASGCYYMQAAGGQLRVMSARAPIEKVIARPSTTDTLKSQLVRARRIRDFASQELGLPDNASYKSYADIGRRYVV